MFFYKNKSNSSGKTRVQDIMVVSGIIILLSILIIGLFPNVDTTGASARRTPGVYIYLIMTFPAILAVYFIIVSFRRKFSNDIFEFNTSIKTKMAMAFLFVAVLPTLPIILVSNNIVNQAIKSIISEKTYSALESALVLAKNEIIDISNTTNTELNWIKYSLDNKFLEISSVKGRGLVSDFARKRGYIFKCYKIKVSNDYRNILEPMAGDSGKTKFSDEVSEYLSLYNIPGEIFISRISTENTSLIVGGYIYGDYLISLFRIIPVNLTEKISVFNSALQNYERNRFLKQYFQSFVGIFLFVLTLVIVFAAILLSLFLSKSITRPVLKLANAAKAVAEGDFSVKLERNASDELTLLFRSFNSMVKQLDYSRILNYNMQKLKAWREVSKKLIHEIKNPLTPIQLSAERIRRRYNEKHENIDEIVNKGTGVIIDEVNALKHILNEFTNFARLPEIKPEMTDINTIIASSIAVFEIYDNIKINFNSKKDLPLLLIDKMLMRQVFTNLIKNAIEAIKEQDHGIIKINTEVKNEKDKEWLIVSIKDNGVGITKEDLDKLFEPSFTRKTSGTGLGLAIVEKIVLEHRGSIYCRSKLDYGTTFYIELPV